MKCYTVRLFFQTVSSSLGNVLCFQGYFAQSASFNPPRWSPPPCSRSPDEAAPVYGLEQPEERESSEASGKKLDKELKQGPAKTDMPEPLAQYELSSYPSESKPHNSLEKSLLSVAKPMCNESLTE